MNYKATNDNYMIELKSVKKFYDNKCVLNIESLKIEHGKVLGIVGDNGAGKTTLLRLISRIENPTEGELDYDNEDIIISSLIEKPALDEELTAFDNLMYVNILCGYKDNIRIGKLLELVGLSDYRNNKVKKFSLGMKQRLGLAMVLIPSPHLLVLDEPLNGVDPNGIIEIRKIISQLKKDDVTILISSHILSELYKVADDFIFIKEGKIVRQFSGTEITETEQDTYILETDDIDITVKVLSHIVDVKTDTDKEGNIVLKLNGCRINDIIKELTDSGVDIKGFSKKKPDLESLYREIC